MSLPEQEIPFRPPLPRPATEIWQAAYRLSRRDFLEAVEYVMPFVAHPIEGLHWEYEGFRRGSLFVWQPNDDTRGLPPVYIEFGMRIDDDLITIYANTASETELQLFRRLTTELDGIEYVAKARVTPCTYVGQRPPIHSPQWA